jgi:hypothetical protein
MEPPDAPWHFDEKSAESQFDDERRSVALVSQNNGLRVANRCSRPVR